MPALQTVALEPRYASRKTRELVYGTAGGALVLSSKVGRLCTLSSQTACLARPAFATGRPVGSVPGSAQHCLHLWPEPCRNPAGCQQGWLGNKETALFTGRGPLRCARMSGTLLAWTTDTGLRWVTLPHQHQAASGTAHSVARLLRLLLLPLFLLLLLLGCC